MTTIASPLYKRTKRLLRAPPPIGGPHNPLLVQALFLLKSFFICILQITFIDSALGLKYLYIFTKKRNPNFIEVEIVFV